MSEKPQENKEKITGGCFCGAVKYTLNGAMMWPGVCHCAVCRKMSGADGGAWFGARRRDLEVSGEMMFVEYTADSGNRVRRGRCAKCAAPVYNMNSMSENVVIVAAGSLDSPDAFVPRMRLYVSSAPQWTMQCAAGRLEMTQFDKMARDG